MGTPALLLRDLPEFLSGMQGGCVVHPQAAADRTARLLSRKHIQGLVTITRMGLLEGSEDVLADTSFGNLIRTERHRKSHGEEAAALQKLREAFGLPRLRGGTWSRHGANVFWAQCDGCQKWRKLGAVHSRRGKFPCAFQQ